MATEEQHQRKSFRIPVGDERRKAELRIGSSRYPVHLHDESAGGFAVITHRAVPVRRGDVVELRTVGSRCEAKVVSMAEAEGEPGRPAGKDSLRLGLERLRELPVAGDHGICSAPWRPAMAGLCPSLGARNAILVALVTVVPVAAVLIVWHYGQSAAETMTPWSGDAVAAAPADTSAAAASETVTPAGQGSSPASAKPGDGLPRWLGSREQAPAPTGAQLKSLSRTLRSLPDVSALIEPQVVRYLSLDASQEFQIRRIAAATREALEKLDRQGAAESEAQRAQRRVTVVQVARQRAMRGLSNRQRERWAMLIEGTVPENP